MFRPIDEHGQGGRTVEWGRDVQAADNDIVPAITIQIAAIDSRQVRGTRRDHSCKPTIARPG